MVAENTRTAEVLTIYMAGGVTMGTSLDFSTYCRRIGEKILEFHETSLFLRSSVKCEPRKRDRRQF